MARGTCPSSSGRSGENTPPSCLQALTAPHSRLSPAAVLCNALTDGLLWLWPRPHRWDPAGGFSEGLLGINQFQMGAWAQFVGTSSGHQRGGHVTAPRRPLRGPAVASRTNTPSGPRTHAAANQKSSESILFLRFRPVNDFLFWPAPFPRSPGRRAAATGSVLEDHLCLLERAGVKGQAQTC